MGLMDIPLNTSTALISVVALGIAVDDTIHFLTEYKRRRTESFTVRNALRQVTQDKGLAITASSLILTIGFGVLLLSNFVPTMNFGALTAVIMITAWIGDIIVLPTAMLTFIKE
jgi:predicted RND superfamily exporter protein